MLTEADTCRKHVIPKLQTAGWDNEPHSIAEQRTITDGRVVPVGKGFIRKPPKRVDFLLRYARDFPLAVVEAKAVYKGHRHREFVRFLRLIEWTRSAGEILVKVGRAKQVLEPHH